MNEELRLTDTKTNRIRVVCPSAERLSLVTREHAEAHFGASKLLERVRKAWHWPGMS